MKVRYSASRHVISYCAILAGNVTNSSINAGKDSLALLVGFFASPSTFQRASHKWRHCFEKKGTHSFLLPAVSPNPLIGGQYEVGARCEQYPNAYSWFLRRIRPIKKFQVKGQLGLYEVNHEIEFFFIRSNFQLVSTSVG